VRSTPILSEKQSQSLGCRQQLSYFEY